MSTFDVWREALITELISLCKSRNLTLGFAESCTGGLVSSWLTEYAGVSSIYKGGVVSYAGTVKTAVLGVPKTLLKTHGEVSLPVARAMASGVRQAVGSTWGLGVTGIAGPGGGTPRKPVGTVCFGVSGPGLETACWQVFPDGGGRKDIQRQAALFAFDYLVNLVR